MSLKWKIVCLILLLTNALTIGWLAYINDERCLAEEQLGGIIWRTGYWEAGKDFDAGQLRIYSLKVVPYPPLGQPFYNLTNEFIGRTNGSLEIWAWPYYQTDEVDNRMLQKQIDGYNVHMTSLYRFYRNPHRPATANANIALTTAFRHNPLKAEPMTVTNSQAP